MNPRTDPPGGGPRQRPAAPRPGPTAREAVLGRVRRALADVPAAERPEDAEVDRGYLDAHLTGPAPQVRELLARNLADYRAAVHRADDESELPALLARLLSAHGSRTAAVPPGLLGAWLTAADGVELLPDGPELTAGRLDTVDSVVTGCAVAIAETGTVVLDAGPGQGRRMLTLVPDHHVLVVRPDQVVASVGQAVARLDPSRPLTWISGPSATSDIELDRVEGVHGPRTLEVVLLSG